MTHTFVCKINRYQYMCERKLENSRTECKYQGKLFLTQHPRSSYIIASIIGEGEQQLVVGVKEFWFQTSFQTKIGDQNT